MSLLEYLEMEHSYRFFENRDCKYFPCHKGLTDFNCLFCYCPLYAKERCPGAPERVRVGEKWVKDCTNCTFPHEPKNYDAIIKCLSDEEHSGETARKNT